MSGHGDGNTLKAVIVAVAVNSVITVAKYIGWAITMSPSLLAEAIHSTADVGNQFLLWVGIKVSEREATEEHPYGWGPAQYLWNLKSAMGIFFLGCGVTLYHGVHHAYLLTKDGPHPQNNDPNHIGIWILVGAVILEGYSWWVAMVGIRDSKGDQGWIEYMKEGDDPTSVGVLLEDSAAVLGVLIALGGLGLSTILHSPIPDIVATLLIGILLGWVAFFLARANGRLLIGASVSKGQMDVIRAALLADEIVEKVSDLKTEILGQGRMRVKCEVDLYEKLMATRMRDALKGDVQRIEESDEETMKVLIDVVGRTIRITGKEIERLEGVIMKVAPTAAHIDLELI